MSSDVANLDRARIRELFDLRSASNVHSGGDFHDDPYPAFHRLREQGPILEGTVHKLIGYWGDAFFQGLPFPERPHFSVFDYAHCDEAFRDGERFVSHPDAVGVDVERDGIGTQSSMLSMNGQQHRRYRTLVQPSFVPGKAKWWIDRWIHETTEGLADMLAGQERADLNVDFCAAIPMLTITGSFGVSTEDALELRASLRDATFGDTSAFMRILGPIVADRKAHPQDDLISVLVQAELKDDDGTHRLSDAEIMSFSYLLLAAGSGTTWKQMGITLAALLERPELLAQVREDRSLLRAVVDESTRWNITDPMFSRFVATDTKLGDVDLPAGACLHLCNGAANRDPSRWEDPDRFDPFRPTQPTLAFGGGAHICLGMHVARAEIYTGINALLDRFPHMEADPDQPKANIIGIYERGPDAVPVLLGEPAAK